MRVKPGWILLAGIGLAGIGWGILRKEGDVAPPPGVDSVGAVPAPVAGIEAPEDARAPNGVRVKVEVLNATTVRGLARRAAMHLRDRGFDVVAIGTTAPQRDSVLVLDRSGHPEWAARVAKAFGGARVEARPDSSRYLDVTVLLGTGWRPPSEPFYP